MPFYTDQLNRTIEIAVPPKRVISLVPSQTELLSDLGLNDEVIGITKFCIHPENWFRQKQRVGGTKKVHLKKIHQLKPDLIIANKEENVKEQVEELAASFPVWISDVNNLEEAYEMITAIGSLTRREERSSALVTAIKKEFESWETISVKYKAAYLIWKDPYMTIGGDTFINDMLHSAGFNNVFSDQSRYPVVEIGDLQQSNCDVILLSSEPYPFQQKHINELKTHLPHTQILLVDGEMFSWYGSRLLKAPAYFKKLRQQIECIV